MTDHTINTALAQIAAGSQGLLQFYVARHSDYEHIAEKAEDGDFEAAAVCAMMSQIGQAMVASSEVMACLLCGTQTGFPGSGGIAIVGSSPLLPGFPCVFRLLCSPCCSVADVELMRAVTDRWKAVVTPTLRVLPSIHEAGRA